MLITAKPIKAHREENPYVENIWQELVDCDPSSTAAVFGVYYEFRNTVQNAFARMMVGSFLYACQCN